VGAYLRAARANLARSGPTIERAFGGSSAKRVRLDDSIQRCPDWVNDGFVHCRSELGQMIGHIPWLPQKVISPLTIRVRTVHLKERVGDDIVADGKTKRRSVNAGGSKVDTSENARVLHLF
jgi:hypothetical protein